MATTALGNVLDHLRTLVCRNEFGTTDGDLMERFIAERNEAAFEALMRRHGPMVLGVSHRILRNEADAEDAFQATFLVLVRKAATVRPRGMVGNWLYGVACTTALKAKAMSSKRLAKERRAAAKPRLESPAQTWDRLQSLLDEELKALPDLYRSAIVLCDLEGKSIKEAAQHFGCAMGTVGPRLARGRRMLAKRLAKRGVVLPAGMIAAALEHQAALAEMSPLLLNATVKTLGPIVAGEPLAKTIVSAKVGALTEGVLKSMFLSKLRIASAVLAAIAIVGFGIGISQTRAVTAEPLHVRTPANAGPSVPESTGLDRSTFEVASFQSGGAEQVEPAVTKALDWIANRQNADGSWEFDGNAKADKVAATGMALLPYLAAGETAKNGAHWKVIEKGFKWLIKAQKNDGRFGTTTMYSHAIATLAVCEAFAATNDADLKTSAEKAATFIVGAQGNDGAWGYQPNNRGDTSILGWQAMALRSAQLAGIPIAKECLAKANKFLDGVANNDHSQYCYTPHATPTPSMSASGLNSRILLGAPPAKDVAEKGLAVLWEKSKPDVKALDFYYYFFATQAFHRTDGEAWQKNWRPAIQKVLLQLQLTEKNDEGSWPKDPRTIGNSCGKLGTTCLAALILEVPGRKLQLFRDRLPDDK